ncbi:hypothetical protein [Candidatus Protochlamydia sp. W-9]|uniref:hypothetical protein n=1 Tax=Candidatus Protochlamydia sp. W-9 TaxID=1785087 RepID=UPI00096A3489|nr:hypothetical protein [Candidatus Protochlamydia sp. W-9]
MRSFFSYRLSYLLLFFCILLGIGLITLPSIISSDWGKKQVVTWINRSIPGQIEISSLNLRWGKGQIIEGILLKDPEGRSVIGIEKFSTDAAFWQFLLGSTDLGETHLQELNVAIVTDNKGDSNLQRAFGYDRHVEYAPLPPTTILLSDVNGTISFFSKGKPLAAHLKGNTKQENLSGNFEIDITLPGLKASNWENLSINAQNYLTIDGSKDAHIYAKIVNFPVELLDRFIALKMPSLNTVFYSLFGDRLNLQINKEPSSEGLAFHLNALSPQMQGDVKGKISKGVFSFREPGRFTLNLRPESINLFTPHYFQLLESSQLKLLVYDFHLPLTFFDSNSIIDPCQIAFKTQAEIPTIFLELPSIGEIKVFSLKTALESTLCAPTANLQLIGQGQLEQEKFDLRFETVVVKPENWQDLQTELKKEMESSLKISNFPLKLVPFLENHPELIKQAGSFADLQFSIKAKNEGEFSLSLSIQTPQIVLNQAQFKIGKEIKLISPLNLSWIFPSDCLKSMFSSEQFALDQPCPVLITINKLHIPLNGQTNSRLQLESTIKLIQLSYLTDLGTVQLKDIQLKIDGDNFSTFQTHLSSQLSFLKNDGFYSPLLNRPVQFNLYTLAQMESHKHLNFPFLLLQMQNSNFKAEIEGSLMNEVLALTKPLQINYLLVPEASQELSAAFQLGLPKLKKPSFIQLTAEPTQVNLESKNLSSLLLNGKLSIDRIETEEKKQGTLLTLEQLQVVYSLQAMKNIAQFDLEGLAYTEGQKQRNSQIDAKIIVNNWLSPNFEIDLNHSSTDITTDIRCLSTKFFSALLNLRDLTPLIGPQLDIDFKTLIAPDRQIPTYWDLFFDSDKLHAKARLRIDKFITLYESANPSGEIRWTITPEAYQHLQTIFSSDKMTPLTLSGPVTLKGNLSHLLIPFPCCTSENLKKGMIDFEFTTTPIKWKEHPTLLPFSVQGQVKSRDLIESIDINLTSTSSDSSVAIDGKISQLFTSEGKLKNWQEINIQSQLKARKLPSLWIQTLLFLNDKQYQRLNALVGEHIDAKILCDLKHLTGPLQLDLKGSNGHVKLNGLLNQGTLTLLDSFNWEIQVTPLLSQTLLEDSMPLLSSAIKAQNPIKLQIAPTGFACPLFPFDVNKISIEKGSVELGKISFRNEGELKNTLDLIRPILENPFTIWFTPLYFKLNKGILNLKRLDFLVGNQYHLASWGEIDLTHEKMNLVLGLSAQALKFAFNIPGLEDNYLLQIPIKGRKGSVEIDKKRAAGRISALVAQLNGDPKAKLLGNVLDAAMSNLLDATPPAPTTTPFPWEKDFNEAKTNNNQNLSDDENKKLFDLNPKGLIKEVEKGVSNFLDKFVK